MCVRKYPACVRKFGLYIKIVLFFLSYDTKISRLLKVSCVCPEIYDLCLKISRLVQILGVCPEISSMCPEILIIKKDYICFLSHDPKFFQIALSFRRVSWIFGHLFKNFQITKNFWHLSWNFQPVFGNFDHTKRLYLFSIIWHNKFQIP